MAKKETYSSAKGKYVKEQMDNGISNQQANRMWSHGKDNPRQQWINAHPRKDRNDNVEYWKSGKPEMQDYAYTADDL